MLKIQLYNFNKQPSYKNFSDNSQLKNRMNCSGFGTLNHDTVSFKGSQNSIKKSDFKGIDFSTVEKYHVDISKFKTTDDLQNWAKEKVDEIKNKDFRGRQQETRIQRSAMLKEWFDYVTKENKAYTPVMQLAILNAVTKDLEPNTDDILPVLNKGVLADTMTEYTKRLEDNPKENINLNKLYKNNLNSTYYGVDEECNSNADFTGWIVIPSKIHDEEHFEENVEKLKTLSHKSWCTKSFNAEPYLSEGDFHIYIENGQPKLGVRFKFDFDKGDFIEEIQGEQNDSKIPVKYLETVKQHVAKNNLKIGYNAESAIKQAQEVEKEINTIKNKLGVDVIKNADAETILPYFGIKAEKDNDGRLIIDKYKQPSFEYTYDDMGIDENKLLKNVKKVKNDINLSDSKATNLENLKYVGGNLFCDGRSDLNLKNLKYAESLDFRRAKNINLESLEEVKVNAHFDYAENVNISNIKKVGRCADFTGARIKNLDSLKECGGLILLYSQVESLKNLEKVGPNLVLNTVIKSIPNLRVVKGNIINLGLGSKLEEMPKLEEISGNIEINSAFLKKLNSLKKVGGNFAVYEDSELEELNSLVEVGRNINIENKKLKSLPKLKTVGKNLNIATNSNLTGLGALETVGESLYSVNNGLSDLHNLRHVGCGLVVLNTKVSDLNNLEFVGGIADLSDTPIEKLEKLKEVGGFLNLNGTKISNPDDYEKLALSGLVC